LIKQFDVFILSLLTISVILSLMEFPWSAVGVIFGAVTLAVLLGYNVPKFVKTFSAPKIDVDLYVYPEKICKQQGVIQNNKGSIFDEEIEVIPKVSPQFFIRIKPRWKYKINTIEVVGYSKSRITRVNLFAEKRFWLEKEYTDTEGNYKVFADLIIRKGHTTDPLLLDIQLDPPFEKGEQRKIEVRVSTDESRKPMLKKFLVKASS
jgi:hypothetical protein